MKKTLAALAVLGAFAGSALAADVTLYGIVDTGFQYQHLDQDAGADATDKFSMNSGMQSGSRFGLKGTEDLGNGLTVGFILENQFNSDDGSLTNEGFFRREANIFLQGNFGKIAFGRMGSINGGTSSWGKIGLISAFGTSWTNSAQVGTVMATGPVYNNAIGYETPEFAGFKVFAQYSMGNTKAADTSSQDDSDWTDAEVENESSTDRYYAIGATYNNGPVAAYFAVDSINYASWNGVKGADGYTGYQASDTEDSLTVTLGGSYDFEVAKVYFGAQYFDEVSAKWLGSTSMDDAVYGIEKPGKVTGYSLLLSADAPLAGGKAMFGVGYYDASAADSVTDPAAGIDFDLTRWVVSAGYNYNLSKRTNAYVIASYVQDKLETEVATAEDVKPTATTLMVGIRHRF